MAQGIFDEQDEIRNENAEHEGDIILLIGYLGALRQREAHVPGRGDPELVDEYSAVLTNAQRDMLIEALRQYQKR